MRLLVIRHGKAEDRDAWAQIDEVPALAPSATPEAVAAWVRRRRGRVAVIGHEPELGELVS
jgi:phosphohistidine phosphatase SixA